MEPHEGSKDLMTLQRLGLAIKEQGAEVNENAFGIQLGSHCEGA